jgi:hypothetical protein
VQEERYEQRKRLIQVRVVGMTKEGSESKL